MDCGCGRARSDAVVIDAASGHAGGRAVRDGCDGVELVRTLVNKRPVCALTTLDDELYVATSASLLIDVFDVISFSLRRRLTVPGVHRNLLDVVSFGAGMVTQFILSCQSI